MLGFGNSSVAFAMLKLSSLSPLIYIMSDIKTAIGY